MPAGDQEFAVDRECQGFAPIVGLDCGEDRAGAGIQDPDGAVIPGHRDSLPVETQLEGSHKVVTGRRSGRCDAFAGRGRAPPDIVDRVALLHCQ